MAATAGAVSLIVMHQLTIRPVEMIVIVTAFPVGEIVNTLALDGGSRLHCVTAPLKKMQVILAVLYVLNVLVLIILKCLTLCFAYKIVVLLLYNKKNSLVFYEPLFLVLQKVYV